MVTALAFSFGASAAWRIQHVGQIKSYVFFGITLWLLARCIERRSIGWGILTGLSAAVMIAEPDQVALLGCYVLAGFVIHAWASAGQPWTAVRETLPALAAAATVCPAGSGPRIAFHRTRCVPWVQARKFGSMENDTARPAPRVDAGK